VQRDPGEYGHGYQRRASGSGLRLEQTHIAPDSAFMESGGSWLRIASSTTWADRLYFPPGGEFSLMTGYGHYLETYERIGQSWMLKTTHIRRIRVEAS
jgi:hypothetical protein